jgi:twinkle protein
MSHDASEINRKLLDRFEEVCLHLLPNGKKKGHHWMVGSIDGDAGESLQITLSGSAAGRFLDFSDKTVKGATPLWLWSSVKKVSFPEAIKQACEFLGVSETDYGVKRHKAKTYMKAGQDGNKPAAEATAVMNYLINERKLDPNVIVAAKVGETPDGQAIVFNFADWDNESNRFVVAHRKYLKLARPDGKKDSWASKGTKRCLYGKNLVGDNVSELVITEGEIDALTWNSYGIPAVSIPNGVSDMEWMDVDWDWLRRFEKIYVSTDMDEPGRQIAPDICKRLGLHRCYIVELPKKDANECLVAGATKEDMEKCLASAKAIELDEIKHPDDFKKEVVDHYLTDPSEIGFSTPWYPDLPFRVRRGELTVLSGFAGHGKTQMLNQLMIHLIQQGVKIMDASLEIRASMTLYYMTRCALAKKYATKVEAEACIDWLNNNLYFLDCIGTVNVDRIMHAMEYSRKRHGTDVFVIDSLFKCGMSGEDFAGAREFMDRLTSFCNNTGAHVILVAHSRKTQNGNEYAIPTKADVAGSSDITNAAFNVIISWRNKMKKRKIDEARQEGNVDELSKWMDQPDGKILLDKQRFGEGEECEVFTWFNKDSCQFHQDSNKSLPYFEVK